MLKLLQLLFYNVPLLLIDIFINQLNKKLHVSQIYAFIFFPFFNVTILYANYTPIVGLDFTNKFLIYLNNTFVFPTPESPAKTTI